MSERGGAMGDVVQFPTGPGREPWLDKRQLAYELGGYSVSWVEKQMQAGMPHRKPGGTANSRVRFKLSEVEAWLAQRMRRSA